MEYTKIKTINEYKSEIINPAKHPDEVFEMYSVPIYETGHPEYLRGHEIGSSKVIVKKNDILLCKINPRINRVWVVADESEHQNIASSEWIVIRNHQYNPDFLAWYFRSPGFKQRMLSALTGIGGSLTRAQPKTVAEYPVPVVKRDRQDEIVINLNRVSNIIQMRRQELKELDKLIKARFVEIFGNLFDSSTVVEWPVKTISDLAESISDGSNVDKALYKKKGDVLFLRIQNVWCNEFRLDDSVFISNEENESYKDTSLKRGDLLITKIGRYYTEDSSLGRVCVYLGEDDKANYSNNIMRVRFRKEMNSEFVNALMNLDDYNKYIRRNSVGGTDKRALSKRLIANYPVVVPPIEIQNEFVDFVHKIDKSKVAVQKSLDETQLLFDSLMQEYFE